MIRIGINGFGRIGRPVFRPICDQGRPGKEIQAVAVNRVVNLINTPQQRVNEKPSCAPANFL